MKKRLDRNMRKVEKMENITIRDVKEEDILAIADIQVSGWKTAYKGIIEDDVLNCMNKNEKVERLKENYKENGFILAELENEIVGFCRYVDSNKFTPDMPDIDCEIAALYVKPNLKGKGIGKRLFQFVVKCLQQKNKNKMIIWCLKDNIPSKNFYKKMGGKIVKERTIQIGERSYWEVGFQYNI